MRAVLMYHSIDESGSPISISPSVFAEHVQWMLRSGVRIVPLDRVLTGPADERSDLVALTFDDGFANVRAAVEQLAAHGLPATVFVVTGHVGRTNAWGGRSQPGIPTLPLLDWSDLERLVDAGVTVGAHTHGHAPLTSLSSGAVEDELDRCLTEIRARLGTTPSWLAYPYGAVSAQVARLASNRFQAALTTRFAPLGGHEPWMWIPRIDMHYLRRPGAISRWGTASFGLWMQWVTLRRYAGQTLRGSFTRGFRPAA
jgi:peptidoglycan/xylan/chitin deacetylase (PgdA/CDA1 family)